MCCLLKMITMQHEYSGACFDEHCVDVAQGVTSQRHAAQYASNRHAQLRHEFTHPELLQALLPVAQERS